MRTPSQSDLNEALREQAEVADALLLQPVVAVDPRGSNGVVVWALFTEVALATLDLQRELRSGRRTVLGVDLHVGVNANVSKRLMPHYPPEF